MDYLASEFLAAYLDVGQSSPKPPGYVVVRTDTVEGLRTLQNSMRRPRVRSAIASAMPSVATLAKASQTPIMDAALQCLITRTSADQADAGPGDAAPLDDAPTDDVQEDPELAEEEEEEDAPPSPLRPVAASAPSLHDMQDGRAVRGHVRATRTSVRERASRCPAVSLGLRLGERLGIRTR
uniref:Uncharacterized protein n=1 Tax=Sexangularia sp. CB-2014 TaxID=1486929 RepID=A0A7S1YAS9_9EUKA|mmetsp:Transcript_11117/g.35299  ORF Transcript_11117/g.35299 Transcript_11117/m.35299 type:complete len:181 (+) Transcript_11117:118-660(+)